MLVSRKPGCSLSFRRRQPQVREEKALRIMECRGAGLHNRCPLLCPTADQATSCVGRSSGRQTCAGAYALTLRVLHMLLAPCEFCASWRKTPRVSSIV